MPFIITHIATIIEVLIACTLLLTLLLAIRTFLYSKESEPAENQIAGLEQTLKKLLEQAAAVPGAGVIAAAGGSEEGQKLVAEIARLKAELETRQGEIADMKTAMSSAGAASGAAGDGKFEAQIQDLRAKLKEYEIISEDIADLSFYKEENAKLQRELLALKGENGVAAPESELASVEAAPATEAPVQSAAAPAAESPTEAVATPAVEAPVETAVAAADPAPAEVAANPENATPPQAEAEAPVVHEIDEDLMSGFAAAIAKNRGEPVPDKAAESQVDLGALDVDKMMAEAAQIETDVPEVNPEQALGSGLDENKLLQEASELQGVSPEDKNLMGQFENFVKKNG